MKLFLVRLHNNNPPILTFGKTRALVGRQMKKFLGPDMVDEVVPVSNQDAETEYGYDYKQQARWNMVRSESVENISTLSGDNPFLREKMDMKKADMGDVIDDFKKSDAPQFQGKSMVKRRQMAIAAKLNANEEQKQDLKLSAVSEGIDQKVLKTFKTMLKDGEEDSVRLLLQGMPKHTKKMYMSRLGIKESEKIDIKTKAFNEIVSHLNLAKKQQIVFSEDSVNDKGHYKMTYIKRSSKDNKLHLNVHHTAVDFKGEKPDNRPRIDNLIKNSEQHKTMKNKGYSISHYGSHDHHDSHEKIHGTKPNITKENVNEDDLEEKTPIKPVIVDRKRPNLKVPNPNYKNKEYVRPYKKDNERSIDVYREDDIDELAAGFATRSVKRPTIKKKPEPITPGPRDRMAALRARLRKETKEAPAGTYFTRSGQLKKGDPASDGKGGAKLASDPLDKQRKTIINLKNYPK